MSRAEVKLTLSTTDFVIVIEALREKKEILEQNMRDEQMGGDTYGDMGTELMILERLLRELE